MPQLFSTVLLVLDLEHSSAMFACHVPTRLGTAIQQIQQSLVMGFDPNHRGEKRSSSVKTEIPLDDKFY